MDMIVVCKLSEREEFVPIILVLVDKKSEVLFQLLVDAFGLTVGLWVVGCGGCQFDSDQLV